MKREEDRFSLVEEEKSLKGTSRRPERKKDLWRVEGSSIYVSHIERSGKIEGSYVVAVCMCCLRDYAHREVHPLSSIEEPQLGSREVLPY